MTDAESRRRQNGEPYLWSRRKNTHTAKTQYRNSYQLFPEKEVRGHSPNSKLRCLWAIYTVYSQDRSAYSAAGRYVDRSWEYINRSQTHEGGNGDWGSAISFLGIHKWDFRCSAWSGRHCTIGLSTGLPTKGVKVHKISFTTEKLNVQLLKSIRSEFEQPHLLLWYIDLKPSQGLSPSNHQP
jgi:hypothetical protein